LQKIYIYTYASVLYGLHGEEKRTQNFGREIWRKEIMLKTWT